MFRNVLQRMLRLTDLSFLFNGLDLIERAACLRVLHALTAVYAGFDHPAKRALDAVIFDGASPAEAQALVCNPHHMTERAPAPPHNWRQ